MKQIKLKTYRKLKTKVEINEFPSIAEMDIEDYNNFISEIHRGAVAVLFTGKSDKKGKEIYDGDIMKSDKGILFTVFWSEGKNGWALVTKNVWQPEKEYTYKSLNFGIEKCEVIGNINEKQ